MRAETLITTPFGADSTAAEVIGGIDLTGKRMIVTGSSSGIGVETARRLPVQARRSRSPCETSKPESEQRRRMATSPQLEGIGGRYFQDCNEAPVVDPAVAEATGSGVAAYAVDPANAERLWELSLATI